MEFYQELRLLPGSEVPVTALWNELYPLLHRGMAAFKDGEGHVPFGCTFPEYEAGAEKCSLGHIMRVFAETKELLEQLDLPDRLQRLQDYFYITRVRPVPKARIKGYVNFSRKHDEANNSAKARRYARRHGMGEKEAMALFKTDKPILKLPYIKMRSGSTGQSFCLFVQKKEGKEPQQGSLGTYGLSEEAYLPDF